ncbi:MAG: radical SAM protein [Clostridia bacterium]|nr:radical SAM protein [Clostridia bacterium]
MLKKCELCPRVCGVDRTKGEMGFCRGGVNAEIALTMLHKWEEPCISGSDPSRGSGAIFFRHCSLGCVYCQNYAISRPGVERGTEKRSTSPGSSEAVCNAENSVSPKFAACTLFAERGTETRSGRSRIRDSVSAIADAMLRLEEKGAYNINLVTPTHYMPLIAVAARKARRNGLTVPIVYNTGGFERAEMIEKLDGTVQIFLTDFKYLTDEAAKRYSGTDRYVDNALAALDKMFEITGRGLEFGQDGMMKRGVIVRHLVLPGRSYAASKIMKKLYAKYGDNIVFSLMNQYTPLPDAIPALTRFPELLEPVREDEYARAVETLESLSPEHAYIQEGGTISESFIPEWD